MSQFILRLDDATHYSDFSKWERLEAFFESANIKPIVCVCPNNKDPKLKYQEYNKDFWKIVRRWQSKEWDIAMHGYEHLFHKVDKKKLFFPFRDSSEFGDLSLEEQRLKIRRSLDVFHHNQIKPSVFAAPRHTFDENTIEAIIHETDIKFISDGFHLYPFHYKGVAIFPQQLWWPQKKHFGVWTICLHPDTMDEDDILSLITRLEELNLTFINIRDYRISIGKKKLINYLYSKFRWFEFNAKNLIKQKFLDAH